ncbi:hypothetical protein J1N35_000694 [Gossypium stocksii]|uniref:Uncharacterized protein n=1 Tax=Gossypium stocksii TaxID=47602 RepID=A0A9D4AKR4_9ROSI|nr:hypothetical protein J1N35_000694 [Gossypium stocksii]
MLQEPSIVPSLATPQPVSSPPVSSPTLVVSYSSSNDTVVQRALGNDALELGQGHREKFPFMKLGAFFTHTIIKKSLSPTSHASEPSSGTPLPIAHYVNCDKLTVKHRNFLTAITTKIGGTSEAEVGEQKDRVTAALNATKARKMNYTSFLWGTWYGGVVSIENSRYKLRDIHERILIFRKSLYRQTPIATAHVLSSCNGKEHRMPALELSAKNGSSCKGLVRISRKVKKQSKRMVRSARARKQSSFQCWYDPFRYSLNFDSSSDESAIDDD